MIKPALLIATALSTVALVAAPTAVAADSTFYAAGTRGFFKPSEVPTDEWESFVPAGFPIPAETVQWPRDFFPVAGLRTLNRSVDIGTDNALILVKDSGAGAGDIVYLVGVSQGAVVVVRTKAALKDDESFKADIVTYTYGDPANPDGGFLTKLPFNLPGIARVVADYSTGDNTTVVIEYDIIADAPDLPRPIAWVNAVLGAIYYHEDYSVELVNDPTREKVITETSYNDGTSTSTHILIKTENLPLTQWLRDIGFSDELVDRIDEPLRKRVDGAYLGVRTHEPEPESPSTETEIESLTTETEPESRTTDTESAEEAAKTARKPVFRPHEKLSEQREQAAEKREQRAEKRAERAAEHKAKREQRRENRKQAEARPAA